MSNDWRNFHFCGKESTSSRDVCSMKFVLWLALMHIFFFSCTFVDFLRKLKKKKRKTQTGFLLQGIKAENVLWGFLNVV